MLPAWKQLNLRPLFTVINDLPTDLHQLWASLPLLLSVCLSVTVITTNRPLPAVGIATIATVCLSVTVITTDRPPPSLPVLLFISKFWYLQNNYASLWNFDLEHFARARHLLQHVINLLGKSDAQQDNLDHRRSTKLTAPATVGKYMRNKYQLSQTDPCDSSCCGQSLTISRTGPSAIADTCFAYICGLFLLLRLKAVDQFWHWISHLADSPRYVWSIVDIMPPAIKKVAHTRLPRVGFRSWSHFLAVSLQVTWVINPEVGCHYFPPGLQLPPQPLSINFAAWWTEARWVWTVYLRLLPDSVTTAIWTQALLRLSPTC